jgi:hypothetical protein
MQRVDGDAGDAEVRADGNGKVVVTLDAPSDVESVEADSFALTAKAAGVDTVEAEKVTFDAEDDRLVVRFDDAALANYVDGEDAELDLYGEYDSSQYEFVYFEHARLNADITVESVETGKQKGNAGNGKQQGNAGNGNQKAVAAPTATAVVA